MQTLPTDRRWVGAAWPLHGPCLPHAALLAQATPGPTVVTENCVCQHSPVLFPRWQLVVLPLYRLPVQVVLMDLVLAGAQV